MQGCAGEWKRKKMVQVDILRLPSLGEHHTFNSPASSLGIKENSLILYQGKDWDGIEAWVVPKWPQYCVCVRGGK